MKKVTKIEAIQPVTLQNKVRVAAYTRVSTSSDDQLESLDAQIRHFEALIKSHLNWKSSGVYVDEGITGRRMDQRKGLQELLEKCRQGQVDLILTKSISRFSRNLEECLKVVRELISLNVAIYFEREDINTLEMDSELILSVLSSLAENESKSIGENIQWSIRKRLESGTYKHIVAPYGYDLVEGRLVINEMQSQVVRDIFAWYLNGEGAFRIAKRLNQLGVEACKSASWKESGIRFILQNERYVGDFLYQKTFTDVQHQKHWNKGDVDQLLLSDDHPAIISRDIFEKVQKLRQARSKKMSQDTQGSYPFSRKIKCGNCGSKFKRRTHYSSNQSSFIAWTCNKHLQSVEMCPQRFVREHDLQVAFMTLINKLIFAREEVLDRLILDLSIPSKEEQRKLNDINNQLKDCQDNFETLEDLRANKLVDSVFYHQQFWELEQKKKIYLKEKRELTNSDEGNLNRVHKLKDLSRYLSKEPYYTSFNEELVNRYLVSIEVINREKFIFELNGGLRLVERRQT